MSTWHPTTLHKLNSPHRDSPSQVAYGWLRRTVNGMIRLENVSVRLNGFALHRVNFCVPTGEYAVLMGRTGCGKTTILEAICGLRPIAEGHIYLMDTEVTHLVPGKRNLGLVPQDAALFTTMTVEEQLGFALRVRNRPKAEIRARVEEMAELLKVTHLLKRRPHRLSGGERQRVALGRALSFRPRVLCLDEPLSALDDETRFQMYDLLKLAQRHEHVTVLHISHNREDADHLADRLLRLENGQVVEYPLKPGSTCGLDSDEIPSCK